MCVKQREEHLQRVFKNRVVREKCVPKKDEVPGDWRKLSNETFLLKTK